MITLKTLKKATKQQVFNQVARHLLTQKCKSQGIVSGDRICKYRTKTGKKCAAGCLISDKEYNPEFEGKGWGSLIEYARINRKHENFIRALQNIHDCLPVRSWQGALRELAKGHKLNTRVLYRNY